MSWITLTEDQVLRRFAGAELSALRSAALAPGQDDPLPEVITQVTREIRAYVAGCATNQLGAEGTIPDECEGAALARIGFEIATRLPVRQLLTEDRKEANRNAVTFLSKISKCEVRIVPPENLAPAEEQAGGIGIQLAPPPDRGLSGF